jgi:hypothetical protein
MHKAITALQLTEKVYELKSAFALSVLLGGRGGAS